MHVHCAFFEFCPDSEQTLELTAGQTNTMRVGGKENNEEEEEEHKTVINATEMKERFGGTGKRIIRFGLFRLEGLIRRS
jgi:hypothetical protein